MSDKVRIGTRWIGRDEPAFIIAEAGSNHDKDFDRARGLIDAAADAGADAVKFQLFSARELYPGGGELYDVIRQLELPREWVPGLVAHARARGLAFLASPFDLDAVDVLEAAGVQAHKIASSETVNLPLVARCGGTGKPVIISTAMCDLADVHEAIEVVRGTGNEQIALLQCSALYPSEPGQAHLAVMDTLRSAFGRPVGFSDHTLGTTVPVVAVARGACLIEKHFTLDRGGAGPDHFYALEPAELKAMVEAIRAAEASVGSAEKRLLPEEAPHARRESLRAARALPAGAVVTAGDIVASRPADGIRPRFERAILGRRLRTDVAAGDAIKWEAIER